jgi:hypothetical protein
MSVIYETDFYGWTQQQAAFTGVETLLIDATERVVERPQDFELQKKTQSGKKNSQPISVL